MAPFLVHALAAGLGVALVSAPLGCFVVSAEGCLGLVLRVCCEPCAARTPWWA